MEKKINAYQFFLEKPAAKRPLGKSRRRWIILKLTLKEI
jgi:hypothetical protein